MLIQQLRVRSVRVRETALLELGNIGSPESEVAVE